MTTTEKTYTHFARGFGYWGVGNGEDDARHALKSFQGATELKKYGYTLYAFNRPLTLKEISEYHGTQYLPTGVRINLVVDLLNRGAIKKSYETNKYRKARQKA